MPQQRRAQLTRRAIIVAAAEEFDREGYEATPLSAILRRSGVTKGAFYFHFASKEALAAALIRLQRQRWPRLRRAWLQSGTDPLSVAVGLVEEYARLVESDVVIRAGAALACHRISGRTGSGVSPEWEELLHDLLRRSSDRGLLRPGIDPSEMARVVCAAMVGARTIGADLARGAGVAARVEEILRAVLQHIASAEWLRGNRPSDGTAE